MTSTPRSLTGDSLNGSWVELNTPDNERLIKSTPVHTGLGLISRNIPLQAMEKLLRDAQKESNQSSTVCSAMQSHSISPVSPHSPPCHSEAISPTEALFLNKEEMERNRLLTSEWIWDWTFRTDLQKEWNSESSSNKPRTNVRQWAIRRGIFSKEVLSLLLLTNILSLVLGAGIGYTILVRKAI